jgi:hypothetical protein
MAVTKSANINWVKDIYIEQEFDVLNDSVFLLTKDYMMSDFALNKREKSKGLYEAHHFFQEPRIQQTQTQGFLQRGSQSCRQYGISQRRPILGGKSFRKTQQRRKGRLQNARHAQNRA